jgi:hypothetical protein
LGLFLSFCATRSLDRRTFLHHSVSAFRKRLEHLPVEVDAAGVILVDLSQQIAHGRIPEVSAATAWPQNIMQLLIAVTAPRQTVTVAAGQSQAGALL